MKREGSDLTIVTWSREVLFVVHEAINRGGYGDAVNASRTELVEPTSQAG